jgi:hypothetical protein
LFFHFDVDIEQAVARGAGADLLDSELPEELDSAFLECLRSAVLGAEMTWTADPPSGGQFHWATEVSFPLETDPVYLFFAA